MDGHTYKSEKLSINRKKFYFKIKFYPRNCSCLVAYALALFLLFSHYTAGYSANINEILEAESKYWTPNSLFCLSELPSASTISASIECPTGSECFPTSANSAGGRLECQDGDMTMFNSLLCFAGINQGCAAVSDAQNSVTGQWFRSPRLRKYPRLRGANSFSPDMALGVMLWATTRPDDEKTKRFRWWVDWIGRNQRCVTEGCTKRVARFCPDDDVDGNSEAVLGCTLKPGDFAILGSVVDFLKIEVTDPDLKRALSKAAPNAVGFVVTSAQLNKPGYSQHLVGVDILILRSLGIDDPALMEAARTLAADQPKNPFFAWLAGSPDTQVAQLISQTCPMSEVQVPTPDQRSDWAWQREDAEEAWKHSMLWDCRFIAALLKDI
ncbi:hypothetical protein U8C31_18290 [Sinorhizobium medicae]|uniref:hypothetical protein n=1 Tax=Sinorhizobium medicae TaxID=110321 RepID=UPI002AF6A49E|nr:hypothetical protein [Sinorhizobium medicae]WQO72186.1 hypothetical protein U8C31_18290 [Sinorhizobium medicae]